MSNPDTISRFNKIYDSTRKPVLAYITAKCKRTADVDDIFQDTYMELYKVLCKRGVDYVTHEKALVLRIARDNLARYFSLSERLRMFISATTVDDEGEEFDITESEADSFLTEDIVVNKIMLYAAQELILQKSESVKKVFYLYNQGLTIAEIAAELSISESNVKNKLYRTINELKNMFNEGDLEYERKRNNGANCPRRNAGHRASPNELPDAIRSKTSLAPASD